MNPNSLCADQEPLSKDPLRTYTKADWRAMAVEFRCARVRIEAKQHRFICAALVHGDWRYHQPPLAVEMAKTLVGDRLMGCGSYGKWLQHHHPDIELRARCSGDVFPYTPGRLAWLDSLIAECDANGAEA